MSPSMLEMAGSILCKSSSGKHSYRELMSAIAVMYSISHHSSISYILSSFSPVMFSKHCVCDVDVLFRTENSTVIVATPWPVMSLCVYWHDWKNKLVWSRRRAVLICEYKHSHLEGNLATEPISKTIGESSSLESVTSWAMSIWPVLQCQEWTACVMGFKISQKVLCCLHSSPAAAVPMSTSCSTELTDGCSHWWPTQHLQVWRKEASCWFQFALCSVINVCDIFRHTVLPPSYGGKPKWSQ